MIEKSYCAICGTILENRNKQACPQCGVPEDFFKSFSIDNLKNHAMSHIIIIGNGIAGFAVAKTLRELHCQCPITIFTKDKHDPNTKHKLSRDYLFSDEHSELDTSWYKQHDVSLLHEQVVHIDIHKQVIRTSQQRYPYDKLVLAMGSEQCLPQVPGVDLKHIYNFDMLYDKQVLKKLIKERRHAVIIGSDMYALEFACVLSDAHMQVDIIESNPHIMPLALNTISCEFVNSFIKSQKIQLHVNCKIKEFHGTSRVESIEFEDGNYINADFVIFSSHKKANVSLLKHSGISYDQRVFTNKQMRTNIKNIYACGSICHSLHATENSFLHACQQGMLTAFHLLESTPPMFPQLSPCYFKHDDFSIFLLGNIRCYDQYIEKFDDVNKTYETYCYIEKQCTGVLLINTDTQIENALTTYQEKRIF